MESREEGSTGDSEKQDWGMLFMLLKGRGFSHQEILQLSYAQFSAYMDNINNPIAYQITIPYLGSGEEKGEKTELNSREELLNIVASMNNDFS